MDYPVDISILIPSYNERESLPELLSWIHRTLDPDNKSYEIIIIDDGSDDGTWEAVKELAAADGCIRAIQFRRNYGKSAALFCGFKAARGRVVVTMDADLQDSPEEIPEMYRMVVEDGWDVVSGWKQHRQDNKLTKNLPSKLYNATARRITGIKLHDMNCGLKAYRNEVVKNIEVYGEMHRYIPYLAKNAGFTRITEKPVHHQKRLHGHLYVRCGIHNDRVDNSGKTGPSGSRTILPGRNGPASVLSCPAGCHPWSNAVPGWIRMRDDLTHVQRQELL